MQFSTLKTVSHEIKIGLKMVWKKIHLRDETLKILKNNLAVKILKIGLIILAKNNIVIHMYVLYSTMQPQ